MLNLYVVGDNCMHVNYLFDKTYHDISEYLVKKSKILHVKKNIEIDMIVSIDFVSLPSLYKFLPGRSDYIRVDSDDIKDIIDFLDYVVRFREWFVDVGSLIGPISSFEAEVWYGQSEVFVHLYSMESGIEMKSPVFNFNGLTYQHLKSIEGLNVEGNKHILNSLIGYSYLDFRIEDEIKKWLMIKNNKLKEGELDMCEIADKATYERIRKRLEDSLDATRYALPALSRASVVGEINVMYGTLRIEDVKFNGPATIVFWNDGTKTVVKWNGHEVLDKEKGLAMAICKKVMGNKGNYYNEFKKWLEE